MGLYDRLCDEWQVAIVLQTAYLLLRSRGTHEGWEFGKQGKGYSLIIITSSERKMLKGKES